MRMLRGDSSATSEFKSYGRWPPLGDFADSHVAPNSQLKLCLKSLHDGRVASSNFYIDS